MPKFYSKEGRVVECEDWMDARKLLVVSHPRIAEMVDQYEMTPEQIAFEIGNDEFEAELHAEYGDVLHGRSEREEAWRRAIASSLYLCWNRDRKKLEEQPDQISVVLAESLDEALASCPPNWTGKKVEPPKGKSPKETLLTQAYYWTEVKEPQVSWSSDPDAYGGAWGFFCRSMVARPLYRPKKVAILLAEPGDDLTPPRFVEPKGKREALPPGKVGIFVDRTHMGIYWCEGRAQAQVEHQIKWGSEKGVYWFMPDRLNPPSAVK